MNHSDSIALLNLFEGLPLLHDSNMGFFNDLT